MQHESIAKLQEQITVLKQENTELRSRLQSFETNSRQQETPDDRPRSIAEPARSQELERRKRLITRSLEERDKATQERAAQLISANTALKKTLDVLATEPDLDRSLGHVLQVTTEHLGSPSAALWLFNPKSDTFSLNLVYLNGKSIPATPENAHLLTNQGYADKIYQEI
jgi:cell shape-determining protein MreC